MKMLFDACPKCWADPHGRKKGTMRLNEDNDLSCITCGKIVVLEERREYDSRAGKKRDYSEKSSRTDVDKSSEMVKSQLRYGGSQNNNSAMARQGGLFKQ